MSKTALFVHEAGTGKLVSFNTSISRISHLLGTFGIKFEHKDDSDIELITNRLSFENGFVSSEVFAVPFTRIMDKHHHVDKEARLIAKGSGVFNIFLDDVQLELHVTAGDFLILPAGTVHTFGSEGPITAIRFFTTHESYQIHYDH